MIDTSKHTFIATAAFGLEGLVKRELLRLGFADARAENGGVRFTADFAGAFTACLWLACADRVLLLMAEGEARSFEELFQLVRSAPWESVLPPDAAIPVSGRCARSQLMSVRDCQAITKKAIVDRMLQGHRVRTLPETGARYAVDVALHGDVARLTLDLCGDALNRRGYRTWNGEAPLRETAAAALVRLSTWRYQEPLHDPCCGTGTLLIEAAYAAAHRASGLTRAFDMEKWPCVDARAQGYPRRRPRAGGFFAPAAHLGQRYQPRSPGAGAPPYPPGRAGRQDHRVSKGYARFAAVRPRAVLSVQSALGRAPGGSQSLRAAVPRHEGPDAAPSRLHAERDHQPSGL